MNWVFVNGKELEIMAMKSIKEVITESIKSHYPSSTIERVEPKKYKVVFKMVVSNWIEHFDGDTEKVINFNQDFTTLITYLSVVHNLKKPSVTFQTEDFSLDGDTLTGIFYLSHR